MTSTLESVGPKGANRYLLNARVPAAAQEEIYVAERVSPLELRGPVIVKHAKRARASFAVLKERLVDEALENASFTHPNLTAVVDVIDNDEGMYLVFENVAGTDLYEINASLQQREQALSFELAAYIGFEMLKGIYHLHTARGPSGERKCITIRDITPASVLVSSLGQVKIANRGLATLLMHTRSLSPADLVAYYAPERIAGEPFSIRSDIYSVGVMLFELLLGRSCFSGASKEEVLTQIVTQGVPVAALHGSDIPEVLQNIVERATCYVPERRYGSAVDMARELEQWLFDHAPKEMARVAARFLTLHDISKPPAQSIEAGANAIPLEGSPLSPDPKRVRPTGGGALVHASPRAPFLDLLSSADIAQMAHLPEFAAMFGDRSPTREECAFFAAVIKDGLTEEEARAIATRSVRNLPPHQDHASDKTPSSPSTPSSSSRSARPAAAQSASAPREVVLRVPPARAHSTARARRRRWWKETALIVFIAIAMLVGTMLLSVLDREMFSDSFIFEE